MLQTLSKREISNSKRLCMGLFAFGGPIILGALTVKIGGFLAFWYLCYLLMLLIPAAIVIYLVYKYTFQIRAEKAEDRFEDEGEKFLLGLMERFDTVFDEILWDRTFYHRSRLQARKPFDRLALLVSAGWLGLPGENKKRMMESIDQDLRAWIQANGLEKNKHSIRLDFYQGGGQVPSLVGRCIDGQAVFIAGQNKFENK